MDRINLGSFGSSECGSARFAARDDAALDDDDVAGRTVVDAGSFSFNFRSAFGFRSPLVIARSSDLAVLLNSSSGSASPSELVTPDSISPVFGFSLAGRLFLGTSSALPSSPDTGRGGGISESDMRVFANLAKAAE
jgi:hypothetical protein